MISRSEDKMIKRIIAIILISCLLPFRTTQAITFLDTSTVKKSVVFLFGANADGTRNNQVATGFLIVVPSKDRQTGSYFLVTARHVVDPLWAGCSTENPNRFFVRVNNKQFDPQTDETGVSYIPVELLHNGASTWLKSNDNDVDLAVLRAPPELWSGKYDVIFLNFRNFGKPDEISKLGVGSQIASAGLVPGLEGKKRNYPVFKFGKIASIPDEMPLVPCRPDASARPIRVWWLAANLVPGNSGSPIYFDPLFPPGADISAGEPRQMLIGLQSIALQGADLAGTTPASYLIDVISQAVPNDADLTLGTPLQ
jgi:hypothetical protein